MAGSSSHLPATSRSWRGIAWSSSAAGPISTSSGSSSSREPSPSPGNRIMTASTLALVSILLSQAPTATTSGPATGSLVIGGGNDVPAIVKAFVELAGGPEAKIVYIPTAIENDEGL